MNMIKVPIKRLYGTDDIPLPAYMTPHSSGMDICAAVKENVVIQPLDKAIIPAGFAIALPVGYEAQIRPRSGLAIKHGIGILNAPGTIDADYRGEVKIIIINLCKYSFEIKRGDRIAQMVIQPVVTACWEEVSELPDSERMDGGFGHTGI
ncbi:dUTP diphosphatase [bacterium]|nr:dUTP diphosphatase [bacterium]